MTNERRLAEVVAALESVGVSSLVMGGHAVRFYGLARNTDDFDLHVPSGVWDDLSDRLASSGLFPEGAVEGESWRAETFRRFRLGTLPSGRDEWLEFWRGNHLLAPREELERRAERGTYGERELAFLGLPDLVRSKETERDKDWRDVAVLERLLDVRLAARVEGGLMARAEAFERLRSRAGFELHLQQGSFGDLAAVAAALALTDNPVTQAYLVPFVPNAPRAEPVCPIEPVLVDRLRALAPDAPLHHSIVEIVRRRYVAVRKDADHRNKEELRGRLWP